MTEITNINLQSIQGTMLIPLWARAACTERFPELLSDSEAVLAVERIQQEFDFSGIAKSYGEYGIVTSGIRAYQLDRAVHSFIDVHPNATIINLGAGLDTTFPRVDNGKIHWYDLDLPEIIQLRQSLFGTSGRNIEVAKSIFDFDWMDEIMFRAEDGIFLIAGGLFYYFHPDQVASIVAELACRFPGGELLFDSCSKSGVSIANRSVKKSGNDSAEMHFFVNSAKPLRAWSPSIQAVEILPYFKHVKREKSNYYRSWGIKTKFNMLFGDLLHMTKFVHIYFKQETDK